jgi:hypothetical protein
MVIAVGVVAAGVGGVTAASLRNLDGDLRLFQAALAAFSAHSLGHVGASVVFRGYTPGIATVPTVIVPYSLWAWRRLRRAGTFTTRTEWFRAARAGVGLAVAAVLLGHVLARATTASAGRLDSEWTCPRAAHKPEEASGARPTCRAGAARFSHVEPAPRWVRLTCFLFLRINRSGDQHPPRCRHAAEARRLPWLSEGAGFGAYGDAHEGAGPGVAGASGRGGTDGEE